MAGKGKSLREIGEEGEERKVVDRAGERRKGKEPKEVVTPVKSTRIRRKIGSSIDQWRSGNA